MEQNDHKETQNYHKYMQNDKKLLQGDYRQMHLTSIYHEQIDGK